MKTFRERCDHCGRGCDGNLHFVIAHPERWVPGAGTRRLSEMEFGTICSLGCLTARRAAETKR